MTTIDLKGEKTYIITNKTNFKNGNYVTAELNDQNTLILNIADAKELEEQLESVLYPAEETRSGLQRRIEELEEQLERKGAA